MAQRGAVLGELEPLVITAPRLRITAPIDPQINMHLLRLLQSRMEARPQSQEALDASVGRLVTLTTATGHKLKMRYTELGFLLTEGLAGVKDLTLRVELERAARQALNPQTKAAALVALAYTKDLAYLGLFQAAMSDPNLTVRLGALEAMFILGDPTSTQFQIGNAGRGDASPIMRIYAAAGMWKAGDVSGREILARFTQDQDWFLRAMATRYMGELGGPWEYHNLMRQLTNETHPIVKAELCSALLRLEQFKDK